MSTQLLEIQPKELKFIFELKKQSSCSVLLTNNTNNYIAFKVKTTSPKKYCVRPNVGIVMPKSTCEFTVTMQAQKVAPQGMVCKDKFLILSTVVPIGTTDNDITASTFSKDDGKYIEESKLKVALVSPPQSPVLSPINGDFKQEHFFKASVVEDPVLSRNEVLTPPHMLVKDVKFKNKDSTLLEFYCQEEKDTELKPIKDVDGGTVSKPSNNVESIPNKNVASGKDMKLANNGEFVPTRDMAHHEEVKLANNREFVPKKDLVHGEEIKLANNIALNRVATGEELNPEKHVVNRVATGEELKPEKHVVNRVSTGEQLRAGKDEELKPEKHVVNGEQLKLAKDVEFRTEKSLEELKLVNDIEEMTSKLNALQSKLNEAESTISKLTEERKVSIKERELLRDELAVLRRGSNNGRKVQVGFPLLFVVMVALISSLAGYLTHP